MLTFLRKIRKSLIKNGNTRKPASPAGRYLLYAIGEILLVMIGILLALQVNNWNEENKRHANEIKIYKEIINDLEECKDDIESDLENTMKLWDATVYVRNHMAEKKPYTDSLMFYLEQIDWDQQFYPKRSAFESLQSLGLYTLTNDSVRLAITDLYQLAFSRLEIQGREKDGNRLINMIRPFYTKHLVLVKNPSDTTEFDLPKYKRRISNYDAFINDQQMLEALQYMLELRGFKGKRYRLCLRDTERVMSMISEEIDRLES